MIQRGKLCNLPPFIIILVNGKFLINQWLHKFEKHLTIENYPYKTSRNDDSSWKIFKFLHNMIFFISITKFYFIFFIFCHWHVMSWLAQRTKVGFLSMFMLCKPSVDFLGQNEPIGTTLGVTSLFSTCLYVS